MAISGAIRTITENVTFILFSSKADRGVRMTNMNKRANKLTHNYIKQLVKLSVYYGADPAYALAKTAHAMDDAAGQIREQQKERANG